MIFNFKYTATYFLMISYAFGATPDAGSITKDIQKNLIKQVFPYQSLQGLN